MTMQILADKEIILLFSTINSDRYISLAGRLLTRNRLLVLFLLDAGLRVGELVQLSWESLYIGQEMNNSIQVDAGTTKTREGRQVPISSKLADCLDLYTNHPAPPLAICPHDFVFPANNPHRHITTRQVRRIVHEVGLLALNRNIHPHLLRHTFATRLMRTTSTRVVQALLGHKSLSSTQIYTHPNSDDMRKAIDSI